MPTDDNNLRRKATQLMDSFLVEAKDQHGNERSLERLNQDRQLFIENLMELWTEEFRRREGEARLDEWETAQRSTVNSKRTTVQTVARERIAELKATIRKEGGA